MKPPPVNSGFDFNPPKNRSLRGHAAKSAAITIGGQLIKLLLRIVSMSVLARLLSPSDYGLVAMATSITAILGAVREAGLSSATIQRKEITHEQVSALFWLNVALGTAMFLVAIALSPLAAAFYKQPELIKLVPIFGLLGVVGSLGIQHMALMQRKMEFRRILTRDISGHVAGLTAGILAARAGAGAWALVVMEAVSISIATITIWMACSWRPSKPSRFREAMSLVGFGSKVMGGALIHHFSKGLDVIVLGGLYGDTNVGLYGRAQQLLAAPVSQVITPIMSVARPALSRAAEEAHRLSRATADLLRLVSFVAAFVVAALAPVSDAVVTLALGKRWIEVAPIFAALSPFAIVESCGALLASVLVASGNPGQLLKWRFISIGIIIVGLLSGLPWGPLGIAIAYGLSGLLLRVPLLILFVSKTTGISRRLMFRAICQNVIFAFLAGLAAYQCRQYFVDPARLDAAAIIVAVSVTVYLAATVSTESGRQIFTKIFVLIKSMMNKKS